MRKGLALFADYTEETKEQMLEFVANNERKFIYDLYKTYK